MEFCVSNNLAQIVSEATLEYSHASALDLVFLNKPQLLNPCTVLPTIADHCPTLVDLMFLECKPPTPISYDCLDFQKAHLPRLQEAMAKTDWSSVFNSDDFDAAFGHLCFYLPFLSMSRRRG